MELRLLRYFVAVARTEHVGRAAEQLHVSQSPLSRQIRQLEDELGVRLFTRSHRRIRLTETGRWLLAEAKPLLERASAIARDARRVAAGELGRIAIGFVTAAMATGLLPGALRTLRTSHPHLAIGLTLMTSRQQSEAVLRGELDLGIVHVAPGPQLASDLLVEEPYALAVAADHPLAHRRAIKPGDLDGQPWITLAAEGGRDRLLAACAAAGFVPEVVAEVPDRASVLALIAAGVGIGIVPSVRQVGDVVLRTLPWFGATNRLWAIRRDRSPGASDALVTAMIAKRRRRG